MRYTKENWATVEQLLRRVMQLDIFSKIEVTDVCAVDDNPDVVAICFETPLYPRGGLQYVELDDLKGIDGPHVQSLVLTAQELFNLGDAYCSFSKGDIVQGIHMILPVVDNSDEGVWSNKVFEGLFEYINKIPEGFGGESYMNAIRLWAKDNGLDIGLER